MDEAVSIKYQSVNNDSDNLNIHYDKMKLSGAMILVETILHLTSNVSASDAKGLTPLHYLICLNFKKYVLNNYFSLFKQPII